MFEISVLISLAPPKLEWWAFLIMAFSVFVVILLINFFVKKVNDAKMEERYKLMYQRCTNQGTQVKESLDLGHRDHKQQPASVSFVYEKKENLNAMKNRDDITKSGTKLHHDKYVSDWMVVYGRNKSNGNLGQEGNRSNNRRNNKDTKSIEAHRVNESTWLTAIVNDIVNTAVAFHENKAVLSS